MPVEIMCGVFQMTFGTVQRAQCIFDLRMPFKTQAKAMKPPTATQLVRKNSRFFFS
jgi:hypothetical protein